MTANTKSMPASLSSQQTDEELVQSLNINKTTVEQIIKPAILECHPDTPLQEAALRMSTVKVSSILVVDEQDNAVGIWTERDVLKLDFDDISSLQRPIKEVMSWPLKTISKTETLQDMTIRFRKERLRHYLVVDENGKRCGIVSQTDVVYNQGIEHYLKLRSIDTIVHRGLQALPETASLTEVTNMMRSAGIDAVAINYQDGVCGIITERDLIRRIARNEVQAKAGEIASRPLLSVKESSSLYRVRNMLIENRLRHVGVTSDAGELISLVSFRDILGSMELTYVQELQQALRDRDEALNISQQNLYLAEQVIKSSLEGIVITDLDTNIISVNPAFTRITGYKAEEIIGKTPAVLSSGRHDKKFYKDMWDKLLSDGYWQGEVWNRRKNDEVFPEYLTITAISNRGDKEATHYAALFSDITELKENEERIRQLAYYDALTGLPNRRLLEDRLNVAIAQAERHKQKVALLFIDLDRFKRINDSLGHDIGDQLLTNIAHRLRNVVRPHDTIARMGGDEFVALLGDLSSPLQAVQIARRMIEALQDQVNIQGNDLLVTSSIGMSVFPDDGNDGATLLRNADAAMYRAKGLGRNALQLYTPAMNASSLENLALENALLHATERNELELYYQPIIDINTGHICSAEALLRWNNPALGLIPPNNFLPLAEESNLIVSISDWIIDSAMSQLAEWHQLGFSQLKLSLNMATRHFYNPSFIRVVETCLRKHAIEPNSITLELTENMLMDDMPKTNERIGHLQKLGLNISLDDFGTGFSSLTHLRSFPLNELKIDREFVRDIHNADSKDRAILSAISQMAQQLGLRVIAEGVENEHQIDYLQKLGYQLLQGYYFSVPLQVAEFTALLEQDQKQPLYQRH